VRPQSDIYSMGLVLYEMLTGQLPFTTEKQGGSFGIFLQQIYEPPRPIEELNPGIPPQLAAAIMQALEKDITRRYRRPADFSQALRSALSTDPLPDLEGSILLKRPTGDVNSNAAIPVASDTQLPIALASTWERSDIPTRTNKSSTDLSDRIVTAITHVLPGDSSKRSSRRFLFFGGVLAMIVLAVLSFARPFFLLSANNAAVVSTELTRKTLSTYAPSTAPMPKNQIACPQAGTARAAVLGSAPYQAQGHNAVVYSISSQDQAGKESGTLMRYDVVTGKSSSIITVPKLLSNVQISGDGQWVIFSTYGDEPGGQLVPLPSQIQMVRIDGQGLQTLYCASSSESPFRDILASPGLDPGRNGWQLFFADSDTMGILSITTGKILQKFSSDHSYQLLQWQSDDDINLLDQGTSGQSKASAQFNLVSLNTYDTLSSANPRLPVNMSIPKSSACSDLDLGTDFSPIFISQCQGRGSSSCSGCYPNKGPSTIDIMKQDPDTGNWSKASPIFTSSTLAIVQVRAITSSSLLFVVQNDDQYSNQNGIWKINTDGSGLQRLFTAKSDATWLSGFSPWFNAARDGSMYAFKTGSTQALGYDQLFIGSLSGGSPTSIVADGVGNINNAQLEIAGWTTI
jgi:eukaryotic-like serine/threonine-protein kinase